jgi:AcrR family transcriptional regulator
MTRRDARENRQIIVDAFRTALGGGDGALPTMTDIVKLSGLGRGTVYRHFPDMGALSFSHINDGFEHLFATSVAALKAADSPEQSRTALREHLGRYRRFAVDNMPYLLSPTCQSSAGYALARKSHRQCVRRALRDMTRRTITAASPELDMMTDVICRLTEPEHMQRLREISPQGVPPSSDAALAKAMELADLATAG